MADVTVSGGPGGAPPINIPVSSSYNSSNAQAALAALSSMISSNMIGIVPYSGTGSIASSTDPNTGVLVTVSGGVQLLPPLPGNADVLIADGSGTVAAIGGTTNNATVISGQTENVVYDNQAQNTTVILGGGYNLVRNTTSTASTNVDVGGSGTLGGSGAIVDSQIGSASISAENNAVVQVIAGGSDTIFAQAGTELIGVTGSSTVPVTVIGEPGANIIYAPQGGNAFINPQSGNVTVLAGTGSETLFGGAATIGGMAFNAPAFTGSATVFSGTGYFQGGSAGNNTLLTSTVASSTTLVGGGSGDYLATYGVGNTLVAGLGSETLAGWTGSSQGGSTFVGGSGQDTIFGSPGGLNTIAFGSGTAVATGQHGATGSTGNTYLELAAGGKATITDFVSGLDKFSLSQSVGRPTETLNVAGGSSVATLSDGTTITFLNNPNVKTTDFS